MDSPVLSHVKSLMSIIYQIGKKGRRKKHTPKKRISLYFDTPNTTRDRAEGYNLCINERLKSKCSDLINIKFWHEERRNALNKYSEYFQKVIFDNSHFSVGHPVQKGKETLEFIIYYNIMAKTDLRKERISLPVCVSFTFHRF